MYRPCNFAPEVLRVYNTAALPILISYDGLFKFVIFNTFKAGKVPLRDRLLLDILIS
jgi:hypothetical protein